MCKYQSDKSVVNKQQICPDLVNKPLQTLKINPCYSNITIDNEWKDLNGKSDLMSWELLTNINARGSSNSDQTDSDVIRLIVMMT